MEMHQLRYFVAVAEELNFTRAAARCHVSQQALSRAVAALERELGERLVVRRPRGCSLTSAGHVAHRDARDVLAGAEALRTRSRRRPARRPITIGLVGDAGPVRRLVAAHQRQGGDLDVVVRHCGGAADVLVPLLAGEVDALVGPGDLSADADVHSTVLGHEPRAALVARASTWADAPALDTTDLLDATFGPRHPLEPRHWEGDWNLVPDRSEQPRRATFDLADDMSAFVQIARAGCVVTQAASIVAEVAALSDLMVAVPMPAARPVPIVLTTTARPRSEVAELRDVLTLHDSR